SSSTATNSRSKRKIAMTRVLKAADDDNWGRTMVSAALALLPAALVGWTGWWVLGVSAMALVTLLFGRDRRVVRKRWDVAATATALLAGIVGVSGAGFAIATVGR